MANDPFMCTMWGEIWGYEMSYAMNAAGISYFDMMDALRRPHRLAPFHGVTKRAMILHHVEISGLDPGTYTASLTYTNTRMGRPLKSDTPALDAQTHLLATTQRQPMWMMAHAFMPREEDGMHVSGCMQLQ